MNKINLLGRLAKDPELKYTTTSNKAVANFTLAINRTYERNKADFINIVAWNKTAEFVSKYFTKGLQVAVSGRVQVRNYENSEGKRVYITEVVAEEVYFADSKKNKCPGLDDVDADGFRPIDTSDDELPF